MLVSQKQIRQKAILPCQGTYMDHSRQSMGVNIWYLHLSLVRWRQLSQFDLGRIPMELVAIQGAHGTDLLHGILRWPAIGRIGRPVWLTERRRKKKSDSSNHSINNHTCKPIIYTIPLDPRSSISPWVYHCRCWSTPSPSISQHCPKPKRFTICSNRP